MLSNNLLSYNMKRTLQTAFLVYTIESSKGVIPIVYLIVYSSSSESSDSRSTKI